MSLFWHASRLIESVPSEMIILILWKGIHIHDSCLISCNTFFELFQNLMFYIEQGIL
jgi:hypothetical protein